MMKNIFFFTLIIIFLNSCAKTHSQNEIDFEKISIKEFQETFSSKITDDIFVIRTLDSLSKTSFIETKSKLNFLSSICLISDGYVSEMLVEIISEVFFADPLGFIFHLHSVENKVCLSNLFEEGIDLNIQYNEELVLNTKNYLTSYTLYKKPENKEMIDNFIENFLNISNYENRSR